MAAQTLFGHELVVIDETNDCDFFATFNIDLDALVQAVRDIARERPDFVYGSMYAACSYQIKGCPACIIGQALARIGVDVNVLMYLDTGGDLEDTKFTSPWSGDTTVRSLAGAGSILLDYDPDIRIKWLNSVQEDQDNDSSWGDAVRRADIRYPLV